MSADHDSPYSGTFGDCYRRVATSAAATTTRCAPGEYQSPCRACTCLKPSFPRCSATSTLGNLTTSVVECALEPEGWGAITAYGGLRLLEVGRWYEGARGCVSALLSRASRQSTGLESGQTQERYKVVAE